MIVGCGLPWCDVLDHAGAFCVPPLNCLYYSIIIVKCQEENIIIFNIFRGAGSVFVVFFSHTYWLFCPYIEYIYCVYAWRTLFTCKIWRFPNIFNKNRFLPWQFMPTNATKYLFCCVRFIIRSDAVKMCLHSVDGLHFLDFVPSGTVQPVRRSRLLLDSTGGGGYGRADRWAFSPSNTEIRKKATPLSKIPQKTKRRFSIL